MESDFDTAIQRLTAWIRDYGDAKPTAFVGDLSMVLLAAKETRQRSDREAAMHAQLTALQAENEELREQLADTCDRARRYAEELIEVQSGKECESQRWAATWRKKYDEAMAAVGRFKEALAIARENITDERVLANLLDIVAYRDTQPGEATQRLLGNPTFRWQQIYEGCDDEIHWALCDDESDKEGLVSDCYLVLLASYPTCCDGKPLSDQWLPKRIIELLNRHGVTDQGQNKPEVTSNTVMETRKL